MAKKDEKTTGEENAPVEKKEAVVKTEQQKAMEDAKYGKILNPKAFVGVTKDEFIKQHKGKLPFDLNGAWEWIKDNR